MMSRRSGFLLLASMSCYFIEIGKRDILDSIHTMLMAMISATIMFAETQIKGEKDVNLSERELEVQGSEVSNG